MSLTNTHEAAGNPYLLPLSADVDEPGGAVAWIGKVGEVSVVGEVGAGGAFGKLEILRIGDEYQIDGQRYEEARAADGTLFLKKPGETVYRYKKDPKTQQRTALPQPGSSSQALAQAAAGGGAQGTNFEILGKKMIEQLQVVNENLQKLQAEFDVLKQQNRKLEEPVKKLEECRHKETSGTASARSRTKEVGSRQQQEHNAQGGTMVAQLSKSLPGNREVGKTAKTGKRQELTHRTAP